MDELSPEFLSLNPQSAKKRPLLIEEHFDRVDKDHEENESGDSDASESSQLSGEVPDKHQKEVGKSKSVRCVLILLSLSMKYILFDCFHGV